MCVRSRLWGYFPLGTILDFFFLFPSSSSLSPSLPLDIISPPPPSFPDPCADALGGDSPADHLLNQSGALSKRLHRRSIHPRNSVIPGLNIIVLSLYFYLLLPNFL